MDGVKPTGAPSFVGPGPGASGGGGRPFSPGNSMTGPRPGVQYPAFHQAAMQPGVQYPKLVNAYQTPGVQYPIARGAILPGVQYPNAVNALQGQNGDFWRGALARAIAGGGGL